MTGNEPDNPYQPPAQDRPASRVTPPHGPSLVAVGALIHWLGGFGSCFAFSSAGVDPLPAFLLAILLGAGLSIAGTIKVFRHHSPVSLRVAAAINLLLIAAVDGGIIWLLIALSVGGHH